MKPLTVNEAAIAALKAESNLTTLKQSLEDALNLHRSHLHTVEQLHVTLVPVLVCRHISRRMRSPSDQFVGAGATTDLVRRSIETFALTADGEIDGSVLYENVNVAIERQLITRCAKCNEECFPGELCYIDEQPLCRTCRKEYDGECGPN